MSLAVEMDPSETDLHKEESFMILANHLRRTTEGGASHLAFTPGANYDSPDNGLRFWEEAVKMTDFPANREAKTVTKGDNVKRLSSKIVDIVGKSSYDDPPTVSVIEIGPGLWKAVELKTRPYIEALSGHDTEIAQYIAIDTSEVCAAQAAEGIERLYPDVDSSYIAHDFNESAQIATTGQPLAILWGPPLFNAELPKGLDPELVLTNQFKGLNRLLGTGGLVLTTYYMAGNEARDRDVYGSEANLNVVRAIMNRFERELDGITNFKAENFEAFEDYIGDDDFGRHVMGMRSTKDQDIHLNDTVRRKFKQGDEIRLVNSWRMSPMRFQDIVTASGGKIVDQIQDNDNGVAVALTRTPLI